jgi:hypothetical protein
LRRSKIMEVQMEILETITVSPNHGEIRRRLRIARDQEWRRVCDLIESVWPLIEPKAAYKACPITSKHSDSVRLGQTCLRSRILRRLLEQSKQLFPYVVTIGKKLEEKIRTSDDILEQYYLDTIGNFALSSLLAEMEDHLQSRYGLQCISSMAPGSLAGWPLEEQGPLFSILGDVNSAIGVQLTEAFLMIPIKSESGIFFPTGEKFYSCQLCPRKDCVNRKTGYDEVFIKGGRNESDTGILGASSIHFDGI